MATFQGAIYQVHIIIIIILNPNDISPSAAVVPNQSGYLGQRSDSGTHINCSKAYIYDLSLNTAPL